MSTDLEFDYVIVGGRRFFENRSAILRVGLVAHARNSLRSVGLRYLLWKGTQSLTALFWRLRLVMEYDA